MLLASIATCADAVATVAKTVERCRSRKKPRRLTSIHALGEHSYLRKGRPWSRLKRYRLLILFAEFMLKANPYFKGEDTETDFGF